MRSNCTKNSRSNILLIIRGDIMKKVFNIWIALMLLILITSWRVLSVKFGDSNTAQIIFANTFIFIAYIIYLIRFYKFNKQQNT
ncbi:hypothetical protein L1F34_002375 [Mammaliicoccus lentus]